MARLFRPLRHAIDDAGYTMADLANLRGVSPGYLRTHFRGLYPWTMEDIQIIGRDILKLPEEKLLAHFTDPEVQYHRPGAKERNTRCRP